MFYSHTYLRRNGRFGLVWLAATQSKVLSKRELYAVNVSMTCSDILNHIPGFMSKEVLQRPRRFSLYLSSQLMYGSVRVLQKQWEYLFLDVSGLFRKFHPEISSEINLVLLKQDPVTIASCVPTSKEYDPFFGLFKESTVDVEAYLDIWDTNYMSKFVPSPSQEPDIKSPSSSVSDPMEIQLKDSHIKPIEPMLPDEQDLPYLDMDNLALLDQAGDVTLSAEELCSPQISKILGVTDFTLAHGLPHLQPFLEATPAVKTNEEMPRTPQKPKRKRPHDVPDERRTKHRIVEQEGVAGIVGASAAEQENLVIGLTIPHPDTGLQTGAKFHRGHDWLQQEPLIQLSPVTPGASPARRRKSRNLIIDQTTQMSREEMKENMLTSESTTQPMILPKIHQVDWFKDAGTKSLRNATLARLWTRNCKFGLRIYDTETESSPTESLTSPLPLVPTKERTRHRFGEAQTPIERITLEKSLSMSIERQRDISTRSASFEGEQSRSLIAQSSDDSQAGLSARKRRPLSDNETIGLEGLSLTGLEQTGELGALPPWPEEQEYMISPIPLPLESDLMVPVPAIEAIDRPERQTWEETDTPRTSVLKFVTNSLRTEDDWTTFRTICPPASCDRIQAARLFMALCCQVEQRNLCVRQDEPYADVFIWLPAGRSE